MSKIGSALIVGGLVLGTVALMRIPASAHFVPSPCDFITSGGFVFKSNNARANFGAHGGCKNEDWWGNVNYVDHGGYQSVRPYHVKSTEITGYLFDPDFPNARDVCGIARTNTNEEVFFRVRLVDNGEGSKACAKDEFGIRLSNGYLVSTRPLADGGSGGGNVQLHKPNPSTTSPCSDPNVDPDTCLENWVCHGLAHPGNPAVGACP